MAPPVATRAASALALAALLGRHGWVGASRELSLGRRNAGAAVSEVRASAGRSCAEACALASGACVGAGGALGAAACGAAPGAPRDCACEDGGNGSGRQLFGEGVGAGVGAGAGPGGGLFRTSPFLMTHDSATGYIGDGDLLYRDSARTQSVNLREQLDCGARVLGLRVLVNGNDFQDIRFHHTSSIAGGYHVGWVSEDQRLSNTLPGLVEWSRAHPEELVILAVSECYTKRSRTLIPPFSKFDWHQIDCADARLMRAFTDLGVKAETSCHKLTKWTLLEARQAARMDGGGRMLVIPGEGKADCVASNFDPQVRASDQVRPYVERTMKAAMSQETLFQVQALQQQAGLVVPLNAELNRDVESWLQDVPSVFKGVNFLEINGICAHGVAISRLLGANVSREDGDMCKAHCMRACRRMGACRL